MNPLIPMNKYTVLMGTFALGLALGTHRSAAAPAIPAHSAPTALQAQPGNTISTPTATVSSKVPPSHSEEDIRDIRQPRHLPSSWPGAAVAAGVFVLCCGAFAAWRWLRRGKFLEMRPDEIALQQLEEARLLMDPDRAREYSFAVSTIIRAYLEQQFRLQAPRLTTEEFLRDLVEVPDSLLASHRALLGEFLLHCDLAKFAGWRYSLPALEEMHASAVDFVLLTAPKPAAAASQAKRPVPDVAAPGAIVPERTLIQAS